MMITSRRFSGASKRPSLVEHYPPPRTATADSHAGTDWSSLCDKGDRREDCMTSLQHQDATTNLFIVPTSSDGSTITASIPVVVGGKTIPHEALSDTSSSTNAPTDPPPNSQQHGNNRICNPRRRQQQRRRRRPRPRPRRSLTACCTRVNCCHHRLCLR